MIALSIFYGIFAIIFASIISALNKKFASYRAQKTILALSIYMDTWRCLGVYHHGSSISLNHLNDATSLRYLGRHWIVFVASWVFN